MMKGSLSNSSMYGSFKDRKSDYGGSLPPRQQNLLIDQNMFKVERVQSEGKQEKIISESKIERKVVKKRTEKGYSFEHMVFVSVMFLGLGLTINPACKYILGL